MFYSQKSNVGRCSSRSIKIYRQFFFFLFSIFYSFNVIFELFYFFTSHKKLLLEY